MKAVVLNENCEPSALKVSEQPVPSPQAGEVRVQVAYCALNPLDTHARAGRIKWGVPSMPFTLGYEYAGRVESVGDGVDKAWIGRRVSVFGCWGGCAEFAIAPVGELHVVPKNMEWPTACAYFTSTFTAWHLVHTAGRVRAGQTVVLHSAAGAVGVMISQMLRDIGTRVIGLVSSREKAEWARAFGVDDWVITTEKAFDDAVKEITGGRGADLIIDGVQGPDAPRNLACVAPFGRVIYIGATGGAAPPVNISQLIGGSISVEGFVVQHAMEITQGSETKDIHKALSSGRWEVPINVRAGLDEVGDLHAKFESRQLMGRTVIRVAGDEL